MAGSTFKGPIKIRKSDNTKVTVIDADGNIDAPVTAASLSTTGTTTLGDAGDATQINGPATVGVDGTGYDVKFYGDTADKFAVWDQSADDLILADAVALQLGGDESTADGFKLEFDGTDSLDLDALTANDKFTIGSVTATDVIITTAGGTATVDASANSLTLTGVNTIVTAGASIASSVATVIAPFIPVATQQALSGAGAVNLTTYYTAVTNTGADALTLADSTVVGQLKKVKMIVDPGTDSTLTFNTNATIVFADVGDYAILMWNGSDWLPIELGNEVDGATAPAYTPAS